MAKHALEIELCKSRHYSSVDRAEREHERVVVTRNGRPAAVLIGYEDLAAIEETLRS